MALIEWDKSIELGIRRFDDDHRQLVGTINLLDTALNDPQRHHILGLILLRLNDYTVYHFRAEEEFMRRIGYDRFEEHLSSHQAFKQELESQVAAFKAGKRIEVPLLHFLRDWLLHHIVEIDGQYARFARSRGLSPDAGEPPI